MLALALVAACRDAERACREAAASPRVDAAWIDRCVRERWSDRRIVCELRRNGGILSMFDDCERL